MVESSWMALLMRLSSLTQERKYGTAQNAKSMDISIIFANPPPQSVGNVRRAMLLPPVPLHQKILSVQTVCKTTKLAPTLVLLWQKPQLNILRTFPLSKHVSQPTQHQKSECSPQVFPDQPQTLS